MPNQNSSEYLDKIKVKLFDNLRMLPHVPGVQMQPIPDDVMDVDRVVDEDKDSDPDKRISQLQTDRRVVDERELSDSEDEDGDKRRNQSNAKQISNKRKASPEPVNGVVVNGNEEILPSDSIVSTTVTKVTTITENGPTDEPTTTAEASGEELIITTTTEEVTKTTTVLVEDETSAVTADESVPIEALTAPLTDGMDTSETS